MFYRLQGWVTTPQGNAVAGASVAILDQPADFDSQPGTPLTEIYANSSSSSDAATIVGAVWNAQTLAIDFATAPPVDVVPGSYIGLADVSPAPFNTATGAPLLVLSVVGDIVTVICENNPGTYVSGGTVTTSLLPNPLTTDGNGYWFCYAPAGLYSFQVYGDTIDEIDYIDQPCGTVAGGSVTSVGVSVPAEFTITGSPVTGAGTIAISKATQNANLVWAGPTSGVAAAPTFRALVSGDLPGSLGTVTSVGLSLTVPAILSVSISGSPVSSTGTLTAAITLQNQAANTFLAGGTSGGASTPAFRAIAVADLPAGAQITTVTVPITSAQLLALKATPVQLVAAPGAGLMLIPLDCTIEYKFNSVAYTGTASATLVIASPAVVGTGMESVQFDADSFLDQTASRVATQPSDTTAMVLSDVTNAGLVLAHTLGTGEFLAGNGTLTVTLSYRTVPVI